MQYDLQKMSPAMRYRLLASTIVPRPIAWVTSRGVDGTINVAPFSYFNLMGHNPPVVVLGFAASGLGERSFKDTPENIISSGEFVVHLVGEADAKQMNLTAIDAPAHVDESALAKLDLLPGEIVSAPRIAQSAVAYECVKQTVLLTGRDQLMVVGEVLYAHIKDEYVIDPEKGHVDTEALGLVAKMHGSGHYARTSDLFVVERKSYEDYLSEERAL
ncbi:flavin reductase family protein [Ensifer sp. ENS05]|uniref:flavin reductase family protein n=1 Tax=Ensifer sp. ENS05 TaxID=2769277 RepID=UPI00177DB763|nr:flavin reductase family protein [Ensifer sp. ENS05]MBD9596887.1 flavin reductase family protein [Ensifer sp. ENS05]